MQNNDENNTKLIHRLDEYITAKGVSFNRLAIDLGLSNSYFSKMVKNSGSVGSDVIEKILRFNPELSAEWLLTGEGDMIKLPIKPIIKDNQEKEAVALATDRGIPLIPLDAVAGFGEENSTAIIEFECEKYVVPDFKGAEFLIQVKGSSMYPKYSSGDIVACKKLPLDTFFQWNKVYVIDSEQGVLIKRVKPGTYDEHITLVSENEKYDPFQIAISEIRSLAIVIGVIRLE